MAQKVSQITLLKSKRKTHVASEVAPASVTVIDVARRWVPIGAGEFVATALTVEIA